VAHAAPSKSASSKPSATPSSKSPTRAAALTAWLQENSGLLPRSLALDSKCGMIVTLCRYEDGRPVAMIPATGKKEDCEVSEARALLAAPTPSLTLKTLII
jgi:hypothetical protein